MIMMVMLVMMVMMVLMIMMVMMENNIAGAAHQLGLARMLAPPDSRTAAQRQWCQTVSNVTSLIRNYKL